MVFGHFPVHLFGQPHKSCVSYNVRHLSGLAAGFSAVFAQHKPGIRKKFGHFTYDLPRPKNLKILSVREVPDKPECQSTFFFL